MIIRMNALLDFEGIVSSGIGTIGLPFIGAVVRTGRARAMRKSSFTPARSKIAKLRTPQSPIVPCRRGHGGSGIPASPESRQSAGSQQVWQTRL